MKSDLPTTPGVAALLGLLTCPESARSLPLAAWDRVLPLARAAGLLAVLEARLSRDAMLEHVPDIVRGHLASGAAAARQRRQMLVWEIVTVRQALAGLDAPIVLLKGAAYLAQGLAMSSGRYAADVDILVPKAALDSAERLLKDYGYEFQHIDAYDERYYREWSHELPPFRLPGHPLELDLHHTITPVTGRLRPDPELLLAATIRVCEVTGGDAGERARFRGLHVLSRPDQLLHSAVHLFHDSDLAVRLRELVDVDGLVREFGTEPGFWPAVVERAQRLGLGKPLGYALRYARAWLGTPVPLGIEWPAPGSRPGRLALVTMDWMAPRALLPVDPAGDGRRGVALARALAYLRYHRLRMPLWRLIPHALHKISRRHDPSRAAAS